MGPLEAHSPGTNLLLRGRSFSGVAASATMPGLAGVCGLLRNNCIPADARLTIPCGALGPRIVASFRLALTFVTNFVFLSSSSFSFLLL